MKNILTNHKVEFFLRVLSGIVGLIFFIFGLGFLILPEIFARVVLSIETRAMGINSLRADFSALFLGMSFFLSNRCSILVPTIVIRSHYFFDYFDHGKNDKFFH